MRNKSDYFKAFLVICLRQLDILLTYNRQTIEIEFLTIKDTKAIMRISVTRIIWPSFEIR